MQRLVDGLECEVNERHYSDGPGGLWSKRAVKIEKNMFLRPVR